MGEASLGGEEEKIGGRWMMDAVSGIQTKSDILSEQKKMPAAKLKSCNSGKGFGLVFKEECQKLMEKRGERND